MIWEDKSEVSIADPARPYDLCEGFEKRRMYMGVSAADFEPWIREAANVSLAGVIPGAKGRGAEAVIDFMLMIYLSIFVSCVLAV